MWGLSVLVLWAVSTSQVNGETESRVVEIAQGLVRGFKEADRDLFVFYGIPYGTVRRRYEAPAPPPSWNGIFNAVNHGIVCPQPMSRAIQGQTTIMVENCLVANVVVPNTNDTNLPVMVSVHGGAFQHGVGTSEMFKTLAEEKNIVTVSFNYRVGVLGFLCMGTKDIPGNAGLKDQLALLRWVKLNIARFGGNPDDITFSGCSAGGASVDIMTLSNTTRGLFNRVITGSGSNLGVFGVQVNPTENAKIAANMLGFEDVDNITALEEFYKNAPMNLLASRSFADNKNAGVYLSPCVEKDLGEEAILLEAPYNIFKRGDYVRYPTVYGFANMEGLRRIHLFNSWKDHMNEKFSDFLPGDLHFESEEERERVANDIKEFYFKGQPVGEDTILSFIDYFSDTVFSYAMMRTVKSHGEAGNFTFYLYEYSFVNDNATPIPFTNVTGANHCHQFNAVRDQDESGLTAEYRNMKRIMRELWGNFIITGVPKVGNTVVPTWPPTNANRSPHMAMGITFEVKGTPMEERTRFWDNIYEQYYRAPIPPSHDSASIIKSACLLHLLIILYLLS